MLLDGEIAGFPLPDSTFVPSRYVWGGTHVSPVYTSAGFLEHVVSFSVVLAFALDGHCAALLDTTLLQRCQLMVGILQS